MRSLVGCCRRSRVRMELHSKCRNAVYPDSGGVQRAPVPDDKVPWTVNWPEYSPAEYTSPAAINKPWADPMLPSPDFQPRWNALDGGVDRRSHHGEYRLDGQSGRPLNPRGRTGLTGRGKLGKWGPNHAADPLVTRWRRDPTSGQVEVDGVSGRPWLQLVVIQRRDCGQWALPGGMVDPGERVTATVRREFEEEALNSLQASPERRAQLRAMIERFFSGGRQVYAGYVDDPRNTDNAWMETVAFNFHDADGKEVGGLPLQAGDDAGDVRWLDVSGEVELYASHRDMVQRAAELLGAHW